MINDILKSFDEEFKPFYSKIDKANYYPILPGYEGKVKSFLKTSLEKQARMIIDDLESNPNPPGKKQLILTIPLWIEKKQSQLRNKYLNQSK